MDSPLYLCQREIAGIHLKSQPLYLLMIGVSLFFESSVFLSKLLHLFLHLHYVCLGVLDIRLSIIHLCSQLLYLLEMSLIHFSLEEGLFCDLRVLHLKFVPLHSQIRDLLLYELSHLLCFLKSSVLCFKIKLLSLKLL